MIIYLTNLPAFYKINLFNRIAQQRKLLVVFTHESMTIRNEDFCKGERKFEFVSIAKKSEIGKILFILKLLKNADYQNLILSGWDKLIMWIAAFSSTKRKNSVAVESSLLESKVTGFVGFLKRVFLSRITIAYVCGKSQSDLMTALKFKGKQITTKGVGIFNIVPQPAYRAYSTVTNFIYVGRLSHEKNLIPLIETFNKLPELKLNIVGYGPQDSVLKSIANKNIIFHGPVDNSDLPQKYYDNEVFILNSSSEPWGLVVEEALNCGLPVIVSDKVGCAEEIIKQDVNGIIFPLSENDGLLNAVLKILDIQYYNTLRRNISLMDFNKVADEQTNCYLYP